MAKATRIESYSVQPDGRVFVNLTKGDAPLPADQSLAELTEFQSVQDFMDAIAAAEERVANDLFLIQAGKALKTDPLLGATFRSAFVGKTPVLDMTGSATTLSLP